MSDTNPVVSEPAAPASPSPTALGTAAEAPAPSPSPAAAAPSPSPETAPAWPDDWRAKLMGEDAEKRGGRFSSPGDVWKAYRALETKISSGELKQAPQAPAKDAAPEAVAAYRKAIGVPDSPAGYLEKLPPGLVVGNPDAPLLTTFLERLHADNVAPEVVHSTMRAYFDVQERVNAEQAEADKAEVQRTTDALYTEWGPEARGNFNAVTGFMRTAFGDDLATQVMESRLPDGTRFGNNPDLIRRMLGLAKELNPAATIVPGHGGATVQSIEGRLQEIRQFMKDKPREYWDNEKMQDEERRLLEASMRAKS